MPHVEALFGDFAEICYKSGRDITQSDLVEADALLCRSITRVNKVLLDNTQVKFVGTATIGIDHLDVEYLDHKGICWRNAAGCNANAVAQYVMSAIAFWAIQQNRTLESLSVGIVGAGNVGTALARCLGWFGSKVMLCDPPLERQGDKRDFVDFETVSRCDVVTFHVPLVRDGNDPTYHMVGEEWLQARQASQLIVNAARGEVIDNKVLAEYLDKDAVPQIVLDVFENEPNIDPLLVKKCLIATPHIAGHTLEGKSQGSFMIYQAFCHHFGLPETKNSQLLYPAENELERLALDLRQSILDIYDIREDDNKLKQILVDPKCAHDVGSYFDGLRKNYPASFSRQPRRDYSGWLLNRQPLEQLFAQINLTGSQSGE